MNIVAAFALAALADLHDELAGRLVLQNHVVAHPGRRRPRPTGASGNPAELY
jgi:hypothetical protein